jgi:hypothetical protein
MASMTERSPGPILEYVDRYHQNQFARRRAEEVALRTQRQREAEAIATQIRNTGELASQLKRTPIQDNTAGEDVNASSSSPPRPRRQDITELDGRALPITSPSKIERSNSGHQTTPTQSRIASPSETTSSRIADLETQLTSQNTRIQELESSHEDLTKQLNDLKALRDEAENALIEATIAGTASLEVKKQQEDIVAELKKHIKDLREERNKAEEEIEELKKNETTLRRELAEERDKVARLEGVAQALERSEGTGTGAASTAAASTMGTSGRRASAGESERRRRGHGRSLSNGSDIHVNWSLFNFADDKDKKKKKKKDSRK